MTVLCLILLPCFKWHVTTLKHVHKKMTRMEINTTQRSKWDTGGEKSWWRRVWQPSAVCRLSSQRGPQLFYVFTSHNRLTAATTLTQWVSVCTYWARLWSRWSCRAPGSFHRGANTEILSLSHSASRWIMRDCTCFLRAMSKGAKHHSFTFHWPELRHVAVPYKKGSWKM